MKDGERCFALIPKIMQEMVTDGPRALFRGDVGNVILLGKVILQAVSMKLWLCIQSNVCFLLHIIYSRLPIATPESIVLLR